MNFCYILSKFLFNCLLSLYYSFALKGKTLVLHLSETDGPLANEYVGCFKCLAVPFKDFNLILLFLVCHSPPPCIFVLPTSGALDIFNSL